MRMALIPLGQVLTASGLLVSATQALAVVGVWLGDQGMETWTLSVRLPFR